MSPPRAVTEADINVVSPGGVATTTLLEFIQRYEQTNCANDSDGVKHASKVAGQAGSRPKVIYLRPTGDEWIYSLDRRGFLRFHAAKLGAVRFWFPGTKGRVRSLRKGVDRQARSLRKSNCDVWEVSENDLWSSATEIAHFIGLCDPSFVSGFPRQRDRATQRAEQIGSAFK